MRLRPWQEIALAQLELGLRWLHDRAEDDRILEAHDTEMSFVAGLACGLLGGYAVRATEAPDFVADVERRRRDRKRKAN